MSVESVRTGLVALLLTCWASETPCAASLPWNLPADVRVEELRQTTGKPDILFGYTLSIEPRTDGAGYRIRVRGLPAVRVGSDPIPWDSVEYMMPLLPPALLVDRSGVIEGLADEANAKRAYAQLLARTWERRGRDFQALAEKDAFIEAAMQRTYQFWVHWVTPVLEAPEPPSDVSTLRSAEGDAPAWEMKIRFLGRSPVDDGLVRYETTTTVDGASLTALARSLGAGGAGEDDAALQIDSRIDRITADVIPGSLRPIRVVATTESRLRRDGRVETREDNSTYKLTWVDHVVVAAPPQVGQCHTARILFPEDLRLSVEGDAVSEMETCGTGHAFQFDNAVVSAKGEVPNGRMEVCLELGKLDRTYLGQFEPNSTQARLTDSNGHTIVLRRMPGNHTGWANFENRTVSEIALYLVQRAGMDFAGEELLGDERVTMRFDTIPYPSLAELLAGISGMRTVTSGTRGRFVIQREARAGGADEP
jgi:hypothetical protein